MQHAALESVMYFVRNRFFIQKMFETVQPICVGDYFYELLGVCAVLGGNTYGLKYMAPMLQDPLKTTTYKNAWRIAVMLAVKKCMNFVNRLMDAITFTQGPLFDDPSDCLDFMSDHSTILQYFQPQGDGRITVQFFNNHTPSTTAVQTTAESPLNPPATPPTIPRAADDISIRYNTVW